MSALLDSLNLESDPCSDPEFRKQAHHICSCYVGGKWQKIPHEKLEIKRIKGATSNVLFICSLSEDYKTSNGVPNKVLLRICFNPDKENSLNDTIVFALLSERNMGPKLHGIFPEGRIEEFVESRPLATHELSNPKISTEIARKLARIHQLHIPILKKPDYIHKALERWIHQLNKIGGNDHKFKVFERFQDLMPKELRVDDLEKECKHLSRLISKSKSQIVFSHNDLQEGNILLPINSNKNDSELGLVFIDFEYASYNYRGFDFANHWVEFTLCYDIDEKPYYEVRKDKFPNEKQRQDFVLNYLSELKPNASKSELETEAKLLEKEGMAFVPASHLFWAIWSFLQSLTSPLSFGFDEYAQDRLYSYFETKHLLDQLEQ